jgi:hypothetical protein
VANSDTVDVRGTQRGIEANGGTVCLKEVEDLGTRSKRSPDAESPG